jgi:hypothetical protein
MKLQLELKIYLNIRKHSINLKVFPGHGVLVNLYTRSPCSRRVALASASSIGLMCEHANYFCVVNFHDFYYLQDAFFHNFYKVKIKSF